MILFFLESNPLVLIPPLCHLFLGMAAMFRSFKVLAIVGAGGRLARLNTGRLLLGIGQ
jgi:hypothetical protein